MWATNGVSTINDAFDQPSYRLMHFGHSIVCWRTAQTSLLLSVVGFLLQHHRHRCHYGVCDAFILSDNMCHKLIQVSFGISFIV
jgi:hypothetical protein